MKKQTANPDKTNIILFSSKKPQEKLLWKYTGARRTTATASLPGDKLVRFTDGSKTDEGSGAGVYDPETEAGSV